MLRKLWICISFCASGLWAFREIPFDKPPEKLSDYKFFEGQLSDLTPARGVIPYDLNTPLFSNYAEKARFIRLPAGSQVALNDSAAIDFPAGTVLIKNFYYPTDFRTPGKSKTILETSLLVHEEQGWNALPYVWNENQTEAYYDAAGETRTITYINLSGKKITSPYIIPNKNQCKGCHFNGKEIIPIGLSVRQLNRNFNYAQGEQNQLVYWHSSGLLSSLPDVTTLPKLAVWDDPATGDLNARARAYLDANCGHCHSSTGAGNTSGLFLDIYEKDLSRLGVNKAPWLREEDPGIFSLTFHQDNHINLF